MLSQSEENYLKAIFHLSQLQEPVTTKAIAQRLDTKPASVSDMLRKLNQKELIQYEKYKEPVLSEMGQIEALKIVRKHRLWECFLVQKLHFSWDEVHEIAEQLEHIKSNLLIDKIDSFLGFPDFDPHGDPIPREDGSIKILNQSPLSEFAMGSKVKVSGLKNHDSDFLKYLNKLHIKMGTSVEVLSKESFDDSIEITVDESFTFFITNQVAKNILVQV